ncbi:MAG: GumC family protein [Terriglobales bacterium]
MAAAPPPNSLGLREFAALLGRRRWLVGLTLVVVWALACALAALLPRRFQSQATLLIRPAQVPATVVAPAAGGGELEQVVQEVLRPQRLAALAARLDVFAPPAASPQQAALRMRRAVRLEWVTAPGERPDSPPAALTLAFTARTPRLAQAVDQQLSAWFIQTNRQARRAQAAGAAHFLAHAVAASGARLASQQQALKAFQALHPELDPQQAAFNAQRLTALEAERTAARQMLDQDQQQQLYLASLQAEYRGLLSAPAPASAGGVTTALDQRIALLQSQLAALKARYTDRYPEVERLQSELNRAQAQRRSGQTGASAGAATPQQMATMTPLLQMESQARSNRLAIQNEKRHLATLAAQIAVYQGRVNAAPVFQQQLTQLEQQTQQAQSEYDRLGAEQHQAHLAMQLEQGPAGAHFRLLGPATLPQRPLFPDPILFSALGLILGAAIGIFLALALDWADDRLHGEAEARAWAPAPVLGAIPALPTPREQRGARRRAAWQWAAASVLALVVLAGNGWMAWHP